MTAKSIDPKYSGNPQPVGVFANDLSTSKHADAEDAASRFMGQMAPNTQPHASTNSSISIAVDPKTLVTTECISVTSAMRKHARWAQSSVSVILGGGAATASGRGSSRFPRSNEGVLADQRHSNHSSKLSNGTFGAEDGLASRWGLRGKKGKSMQDNPLMSAFARLRIDIKSCTGWSTDCNRVEFSLIRYRH